ncbi:MAG: LamG domain-containing protein [Bacteroidales bacterium]|nr:LamG domain-containing protein [Bacteroidales bacterium]
MKYLIFIVFTGLLVGCQYENELDLYYSGESVDSLTSSLVAYFPLDGNFDDVSGNNSLLRAYGEPEFTEGYTEDPYTAISLDGENDFLVGFIGKLDTFSISMWLLSNISYAYEWPAWRSTFFDYSNKQVYGYIDGVTGATQFHCGIESETVLEEDIDNCIGNWFHVYMEVSDDVKMYINGQLRKIKPLQDTSDYWSDIIYFGRASYDDEMELTYFNGKFDEIRVYNRVLNSVEIKELSSK